MSACSASTPGGTPPALRCHPRGRRQDGPRAGDGPRGNPRTTDRRHPAEPGRHVTAPNRRAPAPLGTPLTLSLVVVLVLATFGSFATGFGVLQTCTDLYGY